VSHTPGAAAVDLSSLRPSPYHVPFIGIHSPGPNIAGKTKAISREHLKIAYNQQEGVFEAHPLHKNGFFCEDVHYKSDKVVLKCGDRLQIKDVDFRFIINGVEKGRTGAEEYLEEEIAPPKKRQSHGGKEMSFDFEQSHGNGEVQDTSDELSDVDISPEAISEGEDGEEDEDEDEAEEAEDVDEGDEAEAEEQEEEDSELKRQLPNSALYYHRYPRREDLAGHPKTASCRNESSACSRSSNRKWPRRRFLRFPWSSRPSNARLVGQGNIHCQKMQANVRRNASTSLESQRRRAARDQTQKEGRGKRRRRRFGPNHLLWSSRLRIIRMSNSKSRTRITVSLLTRPLRLLARMDSR
jgi:hypothetical protein